MRVIWIMAFILGTGAGFGAGYLTATNAAPGQQDALRQELLKQLVAAKAGLETGLALGELRTSKKMCKLLWS